MKALSLSEVSPPSAAYGGRRVLMPSAHRSPSTQTHTLQRAARSGALGRAQGGAPADPALLFQSMQGIVQRTSAARVDAQAQVHARTGGSVVQRLISATKFGSDTKLTMRKGKSGPFFKDVKKRLDEYHNPAQPLQDSEKLEALQKLYDVLNVWATSNRALKSSRTAHVTNLMVDVTNEMRRLQPPKIKSVTAPVTTTPTTTPTPTTTAPVDAAHTSPSGGVGKPAREIPAGSETPPQLEAIKVIDRTALSDAQKAHGRAMIRNPKVIEQGAFGVCGLTAILFVVAKSNPKRFAEIISDAWADAELVKQWIPVFEKNATKDHKKVNAEVEFVAAQWLVRKSTTGKVTQNVLEPGNDLPTDALPKEKVYEEVYKQQVKFSDSFEIEGWENTLGHFAMTTGGLNYLMNALGTGKPSYKIKIKEFDKDYNAARAKAGKGSLMASVTNTEFYEDGVTVDDKFENTGEPKYVHWVVLQNAVQSGDYFNLKLWTWAQTFKAKVHKDAIKSHIYSLIAAEAEV